MVVVSAGLHIAVVALAIILPYSLRDTSPKLVSYTVDLVAPDRVGGTNIPGGAKPPPKAKPQAAPPPPAPAAVKEPPAPPKPPEAVKKEPPPKAVEKEVVPPPKPVAKPKEVPKKEPVKVSAKKAEKPEPAKAKEPPKEKAKPVEKKAAAAKPEPVPPKKEAAAEKPKPAPPKNEAAAAEVSPQEARDAIAARLRDERLAAAVERAANRVQQQDAVGNGAGNGAGPASYGPGEGAGGILKGLDWIMYKNRVETLIRENWVWTGSDRTLEATVSFGINDAGEVINVRVEKSSGDLTYDASIERAIKAVSPLPPPPEAYREEFSAYELTFNAEFLQM